MQTAVKERGFDARKYAIPSAEEAFKKYERFIKKTASKYLSYATGCLEFDDLVSAGKIGFFEAVRRYDPLGYKIKRGKKKHLRLCAFSSYVQNSICWHIKNEVKKVVPKYIALDAAIGGDGSEFHELIAAQNTASPFQSALLAEMWRFVGKLPAPQQTVIQLRYKEGKTLEQAGKALGLTRERVRQIEEKAIGKLKRLML